MRVDFAWKFLVFVNLLSPAAAIIVGGTDPYSQQYNASSYTGVVRVNLGGNGLCTGSLFGPSNVYVLTAAHCLTDASGNKVANLTNFTVAFDTVSQTNSLDQITAIYLAPGYVGAGVLGDYENDLAVVKLQSAAPADATSYSLYANTNDIGREIRLVGEGASGTGTTGATIPPSTDSRNRRMGLNDYDEYPTVGPATGDLTHIKWDFDDGTQAHNAIFGSSTGRGTDEATIAGGDSGGPSFDVATGTIIGVHSYVSCFVSATNSNSCSSPPGYQATLNGPAGYFGELGADTRLSLYSSFLTPFTTADAPEPSTSTLLGSATLALFCAARRLRK